MADSDSDSALGCIILLIIFAAIGAAVGGAAGAAVNDEPSNLPPISQHSPLFQEPPDDVEEGK